ncbi:hypothetical protein UPYG_G00255930 [Umbra pygmaea]|uniref:Ankyrin repeat domain-containing protein 63 n=1 Tax=Umbra pygmaea TaxID=75934 RepID=A0ABD0W8F0_UMBPY
MLNICEKSNGQTGVRILLEAMSKDKVHLARFILDALDGEIVDSKTEGAHTPLISSVLLPDSQTRSKFIEMLLHRGASVNCQDESGRTALSYACEKGYLDAVKILVKNNADPEMVDAWGNTALMYATVAGHSLVVAFLVRAFKRLGLQIDRQNNVGNSAVEVAKSLGHTDCFYALTSNSNKPRGKNAGGQNTFPSHIGSDGDVHEKNFERKLFKFTERPVALQACSERDSFIAVDGAWLLKASGRKTNSLVSKSRLQSMDSIEEFDMETDSPIPPQKLVFSAVLTPKPPNRSNNTLISPNPKSVCKVIQTLEKLTSSDNHHLPPLKGEAEHGTEILAPQQAKTNGKASKSCASISASSTSSLCVLLTPITGKKSKDESEKDTMKTVPDFGFRFDDSYYQKRFSLPTSILRPLPPDCSKMPLRKIMWRNAPKANSEIPNSTPPVASSSTSFTVLGSKLLRRFTFPAFKQNGAGAQKGECRDHASGSSRGMPRSETFPLTTTHPQVGSKPSIDSISAVKCEFDFQVKTAHSS